MKLSPLHPLMIEMRRRELAAQLASVRACLTQAVRRLARAWRRF